MDVFAIAYLMLGGLTGMCLIHYSLNHRVLGIGISGIFAFFVGITTLFTSVGLTDMFEQLTDARFDIEDAFYIYFAVTLNLILAGIIANCLSRVTLARIRLLSYKTQPAPIPTPVKQPTQSTPSAQPRA